MIKKLFKYDMLRMKKVWRVFAILIPVIAVAVAFSFRFIDVGMFEDEDLNALIEGLCVLTITFGIAAIIFFAVFNSINVAKCIGRDFFSDVGQLTFTLPVKRDDLFMAKFLNSLIWITVSNLSIIATVFLCILIAPKPETGIINTDVLDAILALFGGGIFNPSVLLVLVCLIEIDVFMAAFLNYCVIKCQSTGGFGMYIGLTLGGLAAVSIVISLCSNGFDLLTASWSQENRDIVTTLIILGVDVILAMLNFAVFFSARDKLKYNFNLT